MSSLDEISRAGLSPVKTSPIDDFLGRVGGGIEYAQKRSQREAEKLDESFKLYKNFREAGYSQEESTDRVNRMTGNTNFIEKIFNEKPPVLGKPTGEDKFEIQKKAADARASRFASESELLPLKKEKLQAETEKAKALADKYKNPSSNNNYSGNKSDFTTNQLQSYIKFLTDEDHNPAFGTPKNDSDLIEARTELRARAKDEYSKRKNKLNEGLQEFNTPEEADASGLPSGSIVKVKGRGRYQI